MELKQIKYYLFPILVLAMVWGTVSGRTGAPEKDPGPAAITISAITSLSTPLADNEDLTAHDSIISFHSPLPDFTISTTKVLQTTFSFAGKKEQTDKDILLLISAKHSNAVKVLHGHYIIFADQLTHVFLYLFPYHFFW